MVYLKNFVDYQNFSFFFVAKGLLNIRPDSTIGKDVKDSLHTIQPSEMARTLTR